MVLVAGDFNGDGNTDLATSGGSILLGNGDDSFRPPIGLGGAPVLSGDFNGDGITDLVFAGSVLFGNGDGTFRQGFTFQAGPPLAVADFNGDGVADLLTASGILLGASPISVTASAGTPQTAAVGTAFAAPLQVKVLNNGVPVSGVAVTFTAPSSGASAALSSPSAQTNASGVASVSATANPVAGSYLVTASYNGITVSFSLTNTVYAVLIATGGTPQSTQVGAAFPIPLQATAKDQAGNPVSGVSVTFTAAASGASATLSSAPAVTNASGVASVTATANNVAGSYSVTASLGSLTALFSLTNTASQAANITATGGALQYAVLNSAFPNALQATVRDAAGNPLSGVTVTFGAPSSGPGATLSSNTAITNASGVASVTATANNVVGSYRVTASAGSLTALFSLTNLSGVSSNLALGKIATQSSTYHGSTGAPANAAVDGNTDGSFPDLSVTATDLDTNVWWQVDLGASAAVSSVVIWNRTDCCGSRLSDYWVFISDTPFLSTDTPATLQSRAGTFSSHQTTAPNPSTTITAGAQGRYVRVQLTGADYLSLAEVQVFGTGAPGNANLSQGKAATQSSTLPGVPTAVASSAVDGNPDGNFLHGSVTATNLDPNPWWQVDLALQRASVPSWSGTAPIVAPRA